MKLETGTPVIVAPLNGIDHGLVVHLPVEGHQGQPVTLQEVLDRGGCPRSWRTLCGETGDVWVYRGFLLRRRPCAACVRIAQLEGQAA